MTEHVGEARRWIAEAWRLAHIQSEYAASWSSSVAGLTAEQAARSPGSGRHTIAQIVGHVCFWREHLVSRVRGGERLEPTVIDRLSWPEPGAADWGGLVERFDRTHAQVLEALQDTGIDATMLEGLLMHDCYHVGQIMYIRSLLGMKPIE
ncbi:MAG: DinB family protein [Phycisphaerales bacterium]|nr:DinB family protein [Phycisphaerales bacterium]